ncbi:hypothetical protein HKD37_02G004906 [Glycine soja]
MGAFLRHGSPLFFTLYSLKLNLQRSSKNAHLLLTFHRLITLEVDERLFGGFVAQCSLCDLLENPSSTVDDSLHIYDDNFYIFGVCNGLICVIESQIGFPLSDTYKVVETYKYLLVLDDLSEVSFVEPELGVVKGCLVCLSHHYLSTHFVVWLMREFGVEKSWTQLRNVSCEYLQIPGRCLCSVRLLCMPEHDDVLLLANNEAEEFVLYNKRDNTIDRTEGFTNSTCAFLSHNYVQSLVSPC